MTRNTLRTASQHTLNTAKTKARCDTGESIRIKPDVSLLNNSMLIYKKKNRKKKNPWKNKKHKKNKIISTDTDKTISNIGR